MICNKKTYGDMFRDLLDNKLTPKPNQKGYSESVSEYLKEYVLFKSEFDCNEKKWLDETITYFRTNTIRIWKKHKGRVSGLQVQNKHAAFFNKQIDASNLSKCNCENCSGSLEEDNTSSQSINPEKDIYTKNVTQDDLIDIPTNVLIKMSKIFHISNNGYKFDIIHNLKEAAQSNPNIRLMVHTSKVQQKKFIEEKSEDLDSILQNEVEKDEYLVQYELVTIEGETSNQTKKRLMDKMVEVDFMKEWSESIVEYDFMKKRSEETKTKPKLIKICKFMIFQYRIKNYAFNFHIQIFL